MNSAPDFAVWLETFLVLGIGVAVVVALAHAGALLGRGATWSRTVWQTAALGLALLVVGQLTGLADGMMVFGGDWLSKPNRSVSTALAQAIRTPNRTLAFVEPIDADGAVSERFDSEADATTPAVPTILPTPPPVEIASARLPPSTPTSDRAASVEGPSQADVTDEVPIDGAGSIARLAGWWPGLFWIVGTLIVAGRMVVAQLLLLVFVRRMTAVDDPALPARLGSVAKRLGHPGWVRIRVAQGLSAPIAFGVLRPTIALPARFGADHDAARQEVMLAHELAHLTSHDPAWRLLVELVVAALWWHPLVWWTRRQWESASESAADEASLVVERGPELLAGCLVDLGRRLAVPRTNAGFAVAGRFRSGVGRRVQRLLRLSGGKWRPVRTRSHRAVRMVGPILVAGVVFLGVAWTRSESVLAQGDSSMGMQNRGWRRSLAGMAFVAALGSVDAAAQAEDEPVAAKAEIEEERPEIMDEESAEDIAKSGADEADPVPEAEPDPATPADETEPIDEADPVPEAEPDPATPVDETEPIDAPEVELDDLAPEADPVGDAGQPSDAEPRRRGRRRRSGSAVVPSESKGSKNASRRTPRRSGAGNPMMMMMGNTGPKPSRPDTIRVKLFRFKHREPTEVFGILKRMFGASTEGPARSKRYVAQHLAKNPAPRFAIDLKEKILVVRGDAEVLNLAGGLVALLDRPTGEPIKPLASSVARIFRLAKLDGNAVVVMLEQLGYQVYAEFDAATNSLIVLGDPKELEEVGGLIEQMLPTETESTGPPGTPGFDFRRPEGKAIGDLRVRNSHQKASATSADAAPVPPTVPPIMIGADGGVWYDGFKRTAEDLSTLLKRRRKTLREEGWERVPLRISAEMGAGQVAVNQIVEIARTAGFGNVNIMTFGADFEKGTRFPGEKR